MKLTTRSLSLALLLTLILTGCGGGGSSNGGGPNATDPDLIVQTRIDDNTGFINAVKLDEVTEITNANGAEINPLTNLCVYNGELFKTESMMGDKIIKYTIIDGVVQKSGEIAAGEASMPTSIIFASDTKAYVALSGAGKLLIFNPSTMITTGEIDLSAYAMDADGNLGGDDMNPEPSSGIIRDGKLYMGLMQVDSFMTVMCRGRASVVIIDVETDTVLSHITDDRTCSTGRPVMNLSVIMDENNDIYFNNLAGFGFYPDMQSGILRIKDGEDSFDPDYYFSITDLEDLGLGDGQASHFMMDFYAGDGKWYVGLNFPSLVSNPPDYVADRSFEYYELDLYNQTATNLGLPPTNGWATGVVLFGDEYLFGLSTVDGDGLFRYDPATDTADQTPYISTEGLPVVVIDYH
jgi:hypothetical protein